jgi:acyl transferase domain-containing protein/acyl carrier protein
MLGHSIGEYVAAHLAGVMSFDDAIAVVAARGRLMQALPAGSMAAVHLSASELERLLGPSARVEIAAVNAPNLCTISGPSDAIAEFGKRLEANGVDFRPLHTSHAFHSTMMEPALVPFEELLERVTLSPPQIPYVSNVTGTWITDEQATSRKYYARHLRQAVQFEPGIRALAADPATLLLEVGPGNALTSLARLSLGKDASKRVFSSLSHPRDRRSDVEATLETTGRMWLSGASIDWATFHTGSSHRRVPLPTYPFDRKRHWVDAQPAAPVDKPTRGARPGKSVDEWLFAPTWSRDDARAATPSLTGSWLVLAPDGLLGAAVARRLTAAGATAIVVAHGSSFQRHDASRFTVRADVGEDMVAVVRDVRGAGGAVTGAIHLWSTAPSNGADIALSHHSLIGLAGALDPSPDAAPIQVIVATVGAESVLDEPVHFPERAIVRGPVLSLPTELPGLRMRSVDIEFAGGDAAVENAASILVEEAANRDGENMVARRAGRRWIRRFERLTLPASDASELPLKARGVYLITGGLGGIGLSLAKWLATKTSARLLLTGRSAMPGPSEWDAWLDTHPATDRTSVSILAIREIEQAGGEVLVAAADAADVVAMKNAIESARARWGSIDGVVHAAGIAGNGRIAFLKNAEDVAAVLAPKMGGLAVLVELLGDTPLDFVVLLSSINSLLGAPGLTDYASANAVLDAFVDSASRPAGWRHVAALNYGPWRGVGMASRLFEGADAVGRRGRNEEFQQSSISPADGTEAFARVLASGRGQVVVIPQDLSYVMELVRAHAAGTLVPLSGAADQVEGSAGASAAMEARPTVSTPYEAPTSDTERRLAEIWSELLGVDQIGMQDDFFELGGHSLLATRVLSRIDHALGARLTLRDIFDAPTVRRLADKVAATGRTSSRSLSATDTDREEMEF